MPAAVETMFSNRIVPWHGLGTIVAEAPSSKEAINLAGLDWNVESKKIYTEDGTIVPNQYANVRDKDGSVLGVVGERYQIVQNSDAFEFTDALLGEGVKYETAGSLKDGRQIWLLALLPDDFKVLGDKVAPYVCFTNTFDGTGSIKVACVYTRVVCSNTLNMALKGAKRTWSARHTGNIDQKMEQARQTLELSRDYMNALNTTFEELYKVKIDKDKVIKLVDDLVPVAEDATSRVVENANRIKSDIIFRWEEAPDLKEREKTGARFIQAVTDTASHISPARLTQNYQANFFASMINGNDLADRAMKLVYAAA